MPLVRLPLMAVHRLLRDPITVFDVVFGRDAVTGRPTQAQEADRVVLMGLQPAGNKVIDLLPEGAQSEGLKVVHTTAAIFAADNFNGGMQGRQTFIRDGVDLWKINKLQDWSIHSNIGKWYATRYVDESGTIT